MIDQSFWYLEDFDIFKLLCPTKYIEMEDMDAKVIEIKKGKNLYIPEDDADKIFFIDHGRIKVYVNNESGKEVILTILEKGDVFGELALIGQEKRNEYAVALEDTEVCFVSLKELKELMHSHTSLQGYMMSLLGKRAMSAEKRLESLVFKDSRTRIIEYLIELVKTKGQRVGYEMLVRKFNTHQEIASLTATSRQSVTSILNDLRNKKILTFDRKRLLVNDMALLEKEILTKDNP